jgi:hypothetical protein
MQLCSGLMRVCSIMSLVTPCSLYYVVPFGQRWRTTYVVVYPTAHVLSFTRQHAGMNAASFARSGFRSWAYLSRRRRG